MTLYPVPKPRRRGKPAPQPLKRRTRLKLGKRMKRFNVKRKGSAFPGYRDPEYRRFIRGEPCLIRGAILPKAISANDVWPGLAWLGARHRCWGPIDPAHVGKHQATGAPDFGRCVPLCRAAHQFYDEHRHAFARATGYTAVRMENAAAGYALKYVGRGGAAFQNRSHHESEH